MQYFDYTISNPPYQLDTGDRNILTIYHHFMQIAQSISTQVTMIYPARWISGGSGKHLTEFRQHELQSRQYQSFTIDAVQKYFHVTLDGDICYFTWQKDYNNFTKYRYHDMTEHRDTLLNQNSFFIRDPRHNTIVSKISTHHPMTPYGRDYYGKAVSTHWKIVALHEELQPGEALATAWYFDHSRRLRSTPVPRRVVEREIDTYKVFVSATAHPSDSSLYRLDRIILGHPGDIISTSFLQIGDYEKYQDAAAMLRYLKTDFATFLFGVLSHQKNVRVQDFQLIPAFDPVSGRLDHDPEKYVNPRATVREMEGQLADIYHLTDAERALMRDSLRPWKDKESLRADG